MKQLVSPNRQILMGRASYIPKLVAIVLRNFIGDKCLDHAASLTYTTLFAIVPLLTVTYSILASFPTLRGAEVEIQAFIFSNFVPAAGERVSEWLSAFSTQARQLTVLGLTFLVVTALLMLRTIDCSINKIFHCAGRRRAVASFLLYWMILTLGPLLLGLGFAATSYLATVKYLDQATITLGVQGVLLKLFPASMSCLAFTLLYLAVPNRKVRFRHALTGGLFVMLIFELTRASFALFLKISSTYQFVYGAFAMVPVFLLWLYLSWLMVLLGGELVHSLGEPIGNDFKPFATVPAMMAVLSVFHQRFIQGKTTRLIHVQQAGWPVSQRDWESITSWLIRERLLIRDSCGALLPARLFSRVSLSHLVSRCPWPLPTGEELRAAQSDLHPSWFKSFLEALEGLNREQERVLSGSLTARLSEREQAK